MESFDPMENLTKTTKIVKKKKKYVRKKTYRNAVNYSSKFDSFANDN